jgi:Zn-dependent protease with chaperone function
MFVGPTLVLSILATVTDAAPLWLAAPAALVCALAWLGVQRHMVPAGARPANEVEHGRALNIARGLARDLDVAEPRLLVTSKPGRNAAPLRAAGRPQIVLTEDLLGTYTRTELEAVIAHCLVRLKEGGLSWHVCSGAAGDILRRAAPYVGRSVDARAASLTRYPPALAAAIEKATPATGAAAGAWFVGISPSHLPPAERAAALRDL